MVAVIFLLYQSSRDGTQLELSFLSEYQVTLKFTVKAMQLVMCTVIYQVWPCLLSCFFFISSCWNTNPTPGYMWILKSPVVVVTVVSIHVTSYLIFLFEVMSNSKSHMITIVFMNAITNCIRFNIYITDIICCV